MHYNSTVMRPNKAADTGHKPLNHIITCSENDYPMGGTPASVIVSAEG